MASSWPITSSRSRLSRSSAWRPFLLESSNVTLDMMLLLYRIAQACASGSAASALRHAFLRNGIHTDVGNFDSNRQAAQAQSKMIWMRRIKHGGCWRVKERHTNVIRSSREIALVIRVSQ